MREQFGIFGVTEDASLCQLFLEEEFVTEDEAEDFLEKNLGANEGFTTYCILRVLVS